MPHVDRRFSTALFFTCVLRKCYNAMQFESSPCLWQEMNKSGEQIKAMKRNFIAAAMDRRGLGIEHVMLKVPRAGICE